MTKFTEKKSKKHVPIFGNSYTVEVTNHSTGNTHIAHSDLNYEIARKCAMRKAKIDR